MEITESHEWLSGVTNFKRTDKVTLTQVKEEVTLSELEKTLTELISEGTDWTGHIEKNVILPIICLFLRTQEDQQSRHIEISYRWPLLKLFSFDKEIPNFPYPYPPFYSSWHQVNVARVKKTLGDQLITLNLPCWIEGFSD